MGALKIMAVYEYQTRGTCSQKIQVELDGRTINSVHFTGGCSGNLRGIAKLVAGRDAGEVIELLKDVRCDSAGTTSCPAQLAIALQEALAK